ncbi:MAG: DUF1365 domain-containing protein [Celeribacter sp.]|jgi:DUF1365 family protein
MTPELIRAKTWHKRIGGPANTFTYSVDYVLLEPEAPAVLPWLFAVNGRNLASVCDRDHGGRRGQGQGADWARAALRDRGHPDLARMKLMLLAQPRIAGFLFDPVSFWLCIDGDDALRAVIAEVNNTFGDRHSYLCVHPDGRAIRPDDEMAAEKVFHVSPFQDIAGGYTFRFRLTDSAVAVHIRHERMTPDGPRGLIATVGGPRLPLSSRRIIGSALRRPMGSLRVVALIYAQALKLWLKGARYRPRPKPPESELS